MSLHCEVLHERFESMDGHNSLYDLQLAIFLNRSFKLTDVLKTHKFYSYYFSLKEKYDTKGIRKQFGLDKKNCGFCESYIRILVVN